VHTALASFTELPSGNWRVQVRRKIRYVSETFRRRKDGEDWALDMERNIDRSGSPKPRAAVQAKTFGDIIDLHVEDMHEVGRPPRRSKAAVLEALKDDAGNGGIACGQKRSHFISGSAIPCAEERAAARSAAALMADQS